jgi:hypothetical protein
MNVRILASTSVPLRPTTVQMPNLVLIETKHITAYTAICFVSISAKFDICTVVGLNGTVVIKLKYSLVHLNVRILASQVSNLDPRWRKCQI